MNTCNKKGLERSLTCGHTGVRSTRCLHTRAPVNGLRESAVVKGVNPTKDICKAQRSGPQEGGTLGRGNIKEENTSTMESPKPGQLKNRYAVQPDSKPEEEYRAKRRELKKNKLALLPVEKIGKIYVRPGQGSQRNHGLNEADNEILLRTGRASVKSESSKVHLPSGSTNTNKGSSCTEKHSPGVAGPSPRYDK